ncbi:MAG: O-antigen ligase family protein [Vicinamibacterales bacterium]
MSLTAIAWVAGYCLFAILSFQNPVFGMLGYMHEYYNRPDLKWWGDELPVLRYNLMISVVWGASYLLKQSSLRKLTPTRNLALPWLLALGAIMLVVTPLFAVNESLSWEWSIQWIKTALIFPFLLYSVVRSRNAFNLFAAAHMLGAFWWGWESWRDPDREAGRLLNVGSGDTQDDNAASAHLLTVLPFIAVYLFTETNKRLRLLALVAAPFVVNTIILCNSRGATVGALAGLLSALLLVRKGQRSRLVGIGAVTVLLFFMIADEQFITRQQSTTNYEEDGAALERLESWQAGIQLVKDRPWGAGGRGFHMLSDRYIPSIVAAHDGELRAPHNTWVMVASEWGVLGFISYLGFIGGTFAMLRRVKQASDGHDFYFWRAIAIQVALVSFLTASTFTDRLYAEVGYWMYGLAYALYRMQRTEQAEALQAAPASAGPDAEATAPARSSAA